MTEKGIPVTGTSFIIYVLTSLFTCGVLSLIAWLVIKGMQG